MKNGQFYDDNKQAQIIMKSSSRITYNLGRDNVRK